MLYPYRGYIYIYIYIFICVCVCECYFMSQVNNEGGIIYKNISSLSLSLSLSLSFPSLHRCEIKQII